MKIMAPHLLAIGLGLFAVSESHAGVPSPATSTCPGTVAIAPDGSCCFDVIVRDGAGNVVPNSNVHVDFGACAVVFCPAQPPGLTIVGNGVNVFTDASGRAHFCVCATITLPCSAAIIADGINLCVVPMANNCPPTPTHGTSWGKLKMIYR
jgi:hypothetical protein